MTWFFRKSLRLGPRRLNLSKCYVGRREGARIGVDGTGEPYSAGGRGGQHFRTWLGGRTPAEVPISFEPSAQRRRWWWLVAVLALLVGLIADVSIGRGWSAGSTPPTAPDLGRSIPRFDGAWNLGARFLISDSDAQILYFVGSLVLTAGLIAVTCYYAVQNKRMADHNARMVYEMRRQNQLAQWDRRANVLRRVNEALDRMAGPGRVDDDVVKRLRDARTDARFLFDAPMYEYLNEILHRAIKARALRLQYSILPENDAQRSLLSVHEAESLTWLSEQWGELIRRFEPYLSVPDTTGPADKNNR